jgi:hypothetical protein
MAELVHEREVELRDSEGTLYDTARIYANPNGRTTWAGWVEFVPEGGGTPVRTGPETTQSNVEGVAYWATGLQPTYFEGALARALARGEVPLVVEADPAFLTLARSDPDAGPGALVHLRIESIDPATPLRLMATNTLVPGTRRRIKDGGVLVYERTVREASADRAGAYEFVAQFGSQNAAGLMANTLWNDLHGLGARLLVEGDEVELTNGAIKDALLTASVK